MADDYDFQINSLKFRAAINDQLPYQRATAPFRKEQFDSAPTVGDQSLTGWWTRGQLSFHMGAGLKYYEVLDGESVLNRFYTSSALNVSTPGVLSLGRGVVSRSVVNVRYAEKVHNYVTNYWLVLKTDGTLAQFVDVEDIGSTAETAVATSDATTADALTSTATKAWVANGTKVESWAPGDAATVSQFTMPNNVRHLWYLKGRLWTVDEMGRWFMFASDTTGAKVAGDAFAVMAEYPYPTNESGVWSATEGPKGIYAARDNKVYIITLDESAAVPTPMPPIIVGELPSDEEIKAIKYGLGHLCIVTARGVRFALVADSGGLTLGPIVSSDILHGSVKEIDLKGSCFLVPGGSAIHGDGIFGFDINNSVSDLVPSFSLLYPVAGGLGEVGVRVAGNTFFWSADRDLWYRVDDGPATAVAQRPALGVLTTGYHRFGTLDPKAFRTVAVRCAGSGGSIDVAVVGADGTATTVGSITPAESAKNFPLGLAGPVERIALRFTLNREPTDSTKGPELVGYQLKALPVPERQRILKWPLMLADEIKLRRGGKVGKKGRALADLKALEALESSNAVVTYTDHRTQETGSAYIDSVEFQSDTPALHNSNGFGGAAYLTLRVLT